MSQNQTKPLTTPAVLAFRRALECSDALMYSGKYAARGQFEGYTPIALQEKSVRGTISNRLKKGDLKKELDPENANLQKVDAAALKTEDDCLGLEFTLKVLPLAEPSACGDLAYQQRYLSRVQGYAEEHGYATLAHHYAQNLVNGRYLWRNLLGAMKLAVELEVHDGEKSQSLSFEEPRLSVREFLPAGKHPQLDQLAGWIAAALKGEQPLFIRVRSFAWLGEMQEVYPSQELTLDEGNGKNKKSRVLYQVNGQAALHSQKVGNALRTVDVWHKGVDEVGPIAAEVYGAVTSMSTAFRLPGTKEDFYSLFDKWMLREDASLTAEQQHYVIAVLIRGGVFGQSAK